MIKLKPGTSKKIIIYGLVLTILALLALGMQTDIPVNDLKLKYCNEHSDFIKIDGMDVHYRIEGSGIPLVLIHGTAASLHTWDGWTERIKQHYRIIRMDLPAFGLTGPHPEGDYTLESYAGFVLDFLAALDVDTFYIAGNSLGGNIAWNIAADHPEKAKKMILLNSSGFPVKKSPSWIFRAARTPVINQVFKYFTPKFIIKNNLNQVYHDDSKITTELVERYHDMALREGNRTAFIDRSKTTFTDHTDKLKNIRPPTLVLWGKEDTWVPVEHSLKFKDLIPGASINILPDTGHIPMEERPELSAKIALEFLNDPQ